jgi:hypothetical protein
MGRGCVVRSYKKQGARSKKQENTRRTFFLLASCLLPLASILSAWADVPKETLTFSHKFHLKEVGAGCATCHEGAKTSERSADRLMPTMPTCGECHDVEDKTQCGMCHKDLKRLEPVAIPAREIVFPHKKHVEIKGMTCERCHQGLDKADLAGPGSLPTMAICMTCHQEITASQDCGSCHSNLMTLRPRSHKDDWIHEHNEHVRSGDITCTICHTQDSCQECHEGANLVKATRATKDFYAPFSPQSGPQQTMTLKRVHTLNYRFTHALDVKGKERHCRTCHELATFCERCHRPEGEVIRFKPEWHGGPDWGAIAGGVGTGGGRHAELMRRDAERCASCHDVQGEDPVCLLCHTDKTPGVGNDPKTHKIGYGRDAGEGPWHEDPNSICFTCHTNTRKAGVGFCGYCHGEKDDED